MHKVPFVSSVIKGDDKHIKNDQLKTYTMKKTLNKTLLYIVSAIVFQFNSAQKVTIQ